MAGPGASGHRSAGRAPARPAGAARRGGARDGGHVVGTLADRLVVAFGYPQARSTTRAAPPRTADRRRNDAPRPAATRPPTAPTSRSARRATGRGGRARATPRRHPACATLGVTPQVAAAARGAGGAGRGAAERRNRPPAARRTGVRGATRQHRDAVPGGVGRHLSPDWRRRAAAADPDVPSSVDALRAERRSPAAGRRPRPVAGRHGAVGGRAGDRQEPPGARARRAPPPGTVLESRCTPEHTDSPLYPVIETVVGAVDSPVDALLEDNGVDVAERRRLLGAAVRPTARRPSSRPAPVARAREGARSSTPW